MQEGYTIDVLDKGFVRYIDHLGSDRRIVESARISYKSPSKGDEQDKKLLNYLYRNAHSSPFEQCSITFNIKLPVFVMRQLVRHRTFRLNEMSARYTEMPDEFYIPGKWRQQDTKNKQGSIDCGDWNPPLHDNKTVSECVEAQCHEAYQLYQEMLEAGVAREMARMILPINLFTEIYINCDLNNLMRFFRLRSDAHAQFEIQCYSNAMFAIFKELFPWCAEAFETGRK